MSSSTSSAYSLMSVSHPSAPSSATDYQEVAPMPLPPSNSHSGPAQVPPAIRNASLHLPLTLPQPPAPFPVVDVTQLLIDEDLKDVPVGFFVSKLRSLGESALLQSILTPTRISRLDSNPQGPTLLRACAATQLHLVPDMVQAPTCIPFSMAEFDPNLDEATSKAAIPTHVLAVRSGDTAKTLLFPIHGLIWASKSPRLGIVSSRACSAPPSPPTSRSREAIPELHAEAEDEEIGGRNATRPTSTPTSPSTPTIAPTGTLPVVDVHLPSSLSLPLLQAYLYLSTDASPLLLRALLPPSATSLLSSEQCTPSSLSSSLSFLPTSTLLKRISLIHSLWQNTVALEISDEGLWETMSLAWTILVGAMGAIEKRRRDGLTSVSEEESERVRRVTA